MIDFVVKGEPWVCRDVEGMTAELGGPPGEEGSRIGDWLARVVGLLMGDGRRWLVVRRLYQVQPVDSSRVVDLKDLQVWTRKSLGDDLGLTGLQLVAELGVARGMVGRVWDEMQAAGVTGGGPGPAPVGGPGGGVGGGELRLGPGVKRVVSVNDRLRAAGFSVAEFEPQDRGAEENEAEKLWFLGRLEESKAQLAIPQAKRMVLSLLVSERTQRRLEEKLGRVDVGSELFARYQESLSAERIRFSADMKALDQMFPFMDALRGGNVFRGVLADLVAVVQAAEARGDLKPKGQLFDQHEIEVLLRTSVQAPEPKYRMGLMVYLAEARAHLMDPEWRGRQDHGVLRKLDVGFARGVREAQGELGEVPRDLMEV